MRSEIIRWGIRMALASAVCVVACAGQHAEPIHVEPAGETLVPVDPILSHLQNLPGTKVTEATPDSGYVSAWEILIPQPLDHDNPAAGQFEQRLFLSHRYANRPTVLITEGYSLGHNYISGLADILNANQLRVEHRYHGQSKPDSLDWRYLTIDQATEDYHRIVDLFRPIYAGKWVSTGWSKGGQTSLIYRSRYPGDVAAVVAYDAPLNLTLEEPRIDAFFEAVGDSICRDRLIRFQRLALERKPELLPLFHWYAQGKGYSYSVGEEKAFEYIVLEYPFSFWQYTEADCDGIPGEDATPDEILEHLKSVVSFWSYSDHAMDSAAMYQFCTQLGYYGYVTKNVSDMLSDTDYPNCAYAPRDADVTYDPEPMRRLNDWLLEFGDNVIYIYGADDPWSAPFVDTSSRNNARTFFLDGGNHFTFIGTFPTSQRKEIVDLLNGWLD
jgi:pimeloyl-ACP methyl ester carboxylesterase